jgi:hypothetical protein
MVFKLRMGFFLWESGQMELSIMYYLGPMDIFTFYKLRLIVHLIQFFYINSKINIL